VETALGIADGIVTIIRETDGQQREEFFSQKGACPVCGISLPEMEPRLFSFNAPQGACPACGGLGMNMEFSPDLIIPDRSLSFNEGGCLPYNPQSAWNRSRFEALAHHFHFSLDTPFDKLPEDVMEAILYGSDSDIHFRYDNRDKTGHFEYQTKFPGILADLRRRYMETTSDDIKEWFESFMVEKECEVCHGKRLRPEALAVTVGGKNIYEITCMTIGESVKFFESLRLSDTEFQISKLILKEIVARLGFLRNVGLDYLTLERKASTLSGGEAQRIRLATQIGSSLVGVLYILDEPSIGLHQRDNQRLIDTLTYLEISETR